MTPTNEQKPPETALAVQPVARPPLRELLQTLKDTDADLLKSFARDIIERDVAMALYDQDWQLARVMAQSAYFTDLEGANPGQSIAKAMTKIQLGRSWHMSPADSVQHVYVVNGRPAVQNEYLASQMRQAGIDWKIQWHKDKDGVCNGCTLWPMRLQPDGSYQPITEVEMRDGKLVEVPASVSFTKAMADRVQVKEDGKWIALSEKSTYKAWPDDLYFWRAIARLRRRYCTNILNGVYTREEASEIQQEKEVLPVAKVPLEVSAGDFTPSSRRRTQAGAAVIPGTAPVTVPPAQWDEPKETILDGDDSGPGDPLPADPPAAPAQPAQSSKEDVLRANLLAQINGIRIELGDPKFTGRLFSISPSITIESLPNMQNGQLQSILNSLNKPAPAPQPKPEPAGGTPQSPQSPKFKF